MQKVNLYFIFIAVALLACKKDKKINPFDDPALQPPPVQQTNYNPDPATFEYLYDNIFSKTCANSNCHDGTFQPDFRSIGSSYNSLVYAPVISTPTNNPFTYRVMPGDANASLIKFRLTQIPASGVGTFGQGRMPWNDTSYKFSAAGSANIQHIIDWINNGAKDIFGNAPVKGNSNPNTLGFQVCNTGTSTPFARNRYLEISKTNGPVDMWFYITDDVTPPQNMQSSVVKFSTNKYDFTAATSMTLNYVPNGNTYKEITNTTDVQYSYKLTNYNLSAIQPDTGYIFVRTYFRDPDHITPAETPNNGSVYYTDYFVIKITP